MFKDQATAASAAESIAGIASASTMLNELLLSIEHSLQLQLADLASSMDVEAQDRFTKADPERWLENARHNLQSGLMFLERAVQQPTRF